MIAALPLTLGACQAAPPPTPPARVTPTATATASATPTPGPPLASCPAPQAATSLTAFAHTDLSPDDLLAMPDGSLWVTDPDGGVVEHLAPGGSRLLRFADREAPEGMVALGTEIVLAEQRTNRLVTFMPPATSPLAPLVALPSPGSQEGVDGIGDDPSNGRLLVPDSAHGTLLSVSADGTQTTVLASGLGRDVDAAVGPDGAIWVAIEGSRGLARVPPAGGAWTAVGGLAQLDDLVTVGPLLYATLVDAGELVAIDPASGADRVLVTGIGSAQGLALLADGRLALADSTRRVIDVVSPCPVG